MTTDAHYDLAIVGGGIAGPALGAAVADAGYRTLLIERSADPLDTARGDHLQPITVEALERWGVLDAMFEHGAEKRLGSRWLLPDGELVVATPTDDLPIPHPYHIYLNHELISEVLLERAARNPNFEIRRPATARVLRDDVAAGRHALEVVGGARITADCIAVADGRTSRGRTALGIDACVHNYENPLVTMFADRTFDHSSSGARNEVQVFLTDAGIVSVVPRIGNRWKIGFPIARADLKHWSEADPQQIGRRLTELVPRLEGIVPSYAGFYPVAMVNAETWIEGNCVLLGDACHALHPGRSQGMNVALRGVARLADKLKDADFPASPTTVPDLLADFEAELKPPIDARLEENHARGLAMDRMDAETVERTRAAMADLAASPEKLHAYCMHAAGY